MDFKFEISATAFDFFKMSMKKTYKSPLGICNIVFFAALVLVTVKMFGEAGPFLRALLLILCLAFPVIQPLSIYLRAAALARMIPENMTLETVKDGLIVRVGEQSELIPYSRISRLVCADDCVIIYVGGQHGYFLFNRVMGDRKEEFVRFIKSKMEV